MYIGKGIWGTGKMRRRRRGREGEGGEGGGGLVVCCVRGVCGDVLV